MEVVDINNKKTGEVELSPSIFAGEVKPHLLHDAVVCRMARGRSGTHKTKTRTEVRGGGRKPWKQKGLGRARAGSIRSPLFRGGGITFGPTPRNYGYSMPKSARRAALISALSLKAKENAIMVIDKLELSEPKTKQAVAMLKTLGVSGIKALFVSDERNTNVELGLRNVPNVKLIGAGALNVYDLLHADRVIITQGALEKAQERLG